MNWNSETELLPGIKIGGKNPFFLIAGPCVAESQTLLDETAGRLKVITDKLGIRFIFKASYDKANRSSINSYRGPGIDKGLKMLAEIKAKFSLPVLTDIHGPEEAAEAATVADILQIPAFLCRQTDLLWKAALTGKWVNVKKGQFLAPGDAGQIVEKFKEAGSDKVSVCERGFTFGYNNLVVDMRGLEQMRNSGIHVVMDCTHATQLPGGGTVSGGQREMAFPLARAACAVGVDGLFMEIHPDPPKAKSDATNQLYLKDAENILTSLQQIDRLVKNF